MNKRNTDIYLPALMHIFLGCNLVAMETTNIEPIIVDHNENQSIATVIEKPALIAVFGATPRYAYFQNYMQTVQQHYESLKSHYQRQKRLKGVERSKKQFLQHPAAPTFETHLRNASDIEKIRLFFCRRH